MVNYTCINCNKIFLLKEDYEKHINRKTKCNKLKNNNFYLNNKKNSYNFEVYCIDLHNKLYNTQTAIHWNDISEDILYDSGFINDFNSLRLSRKKIKENISNPLQEYGLDGISIETIDGKKYYHGLQMKLWNTKNKLTAHHLGTFYGVLFCRFFIKNAFSKGYLYHTNKLEDNVDSDIKNVNRVISSKIDIDEFYKNLNSNNVVVNDNIINNEFVLRNYQQEALKKLNENWIGIKSLILPCGTGKTFIVSKYLENTHYKNIFIFSPLRIHANQILNYVSKFLPNYKKMLVDCDGIIDINEINKILNENCIISTTFKSAKDTISLLFDKNNNFNTENSILIVDEAHNLTVNQNEDNKNIIDVINRFKKVLLLTATPPTYIEEIFNCKPIFKYSMNEAIKNNYICDYQIHLPSIINNIVDIDKPNELLDLDNDLCKKGLFLINGMLKTGSKRCIIYLFSIDECILFKKVISEIVDKYHSLPYWIETITCDTKNREIIIDNFQKNEKRLDTLKFLLSIRILDEGIDIVKCDSVFITTIGDSTSDIKTIQRICRANRLDSSNKLKKANCFMWCDDLNRTVNALKLLKENDIDFVKKITIRNGNYERNNEKNIIVEKQNIKLTEHITVKCLSLCEIFEYKKNLLFKFAELNGRTPNDKELFENIDIGTWFEIQKNKINNDTDEIYNVLSTDNIVKNELGKYLKKKLYLSDENKSTEDNSKITKHVCVKCNKKYTTLKTLKIHEKTYCKGENYNPFECKKCNKIFSRTCYAKQHEKKCNYVKQKNEDKTITNNITNNVATNIATNCNNNIDNSNNKTINNITINAYGKENFEMCKIEKKFIMEYCFNSLCLYIKRIHFNKDKPENHNMFITNLKSNNVSVFDGKKIKLESYKTVLKRLNNYHYKLKFIYEDVKKEISKTCKRQFPIFLDFADESNESEFSKEYREDLSKEIKLLLYNEREMAMTTLRNKNIQLN